MLHSHLLPDVYLFLAAGVMPALGIGWGGVEKGIWAVKCGKGKRGQAWQFLSALQYLLTAEALRDCLAARPMGSPMICPQTHS